MSENGSKPCPCARVSRKQHCPPSSARSSDTRMQAARTAVVDPRHCERPSPGAFVVLDGGAVAVGHPSCGRARGQRSGRRVGRGRWWAFSADSIAVSDSVERGHQETVAPFRIASSTRISSRHPVSRTAARAWCSSTSAARSARWTCEMCQRRGWAGETTSTCSRESLARRPNPARCISYRAERLFASR